MKVAASFAVALAVAACQVWSGAAKIVWPFTAISTPFPKPVGIDYYWPTDQVILSVYYPSGKPNNFELVQMDGTHVPFAPSLMGNSDEVKIALVRPDPRPAGSGGFTPGDFFTGNGVDSQIIRVSQNGTVISNPWVVLPSLAGALNGLMRGGLYVDHTGVWGYDLLAVTTKGMAYRIGPDKRVTRLGTTLNCHLEGLITVPNLPLVWGGLAGRALSGAENSYELHSWNTSGHVKSWKVPIAIEDLDWIQGGNFFGVNYQLGRLLGVPKEFLDPYTGLILVTQEMCNVNSFGGFWSGLSILTWDFTTNAPKFEPIFFDPAFFAPLPGQWEHVTVAPAGIKEIAPVGFSLCLAGRVASAGAASLTSRDVTPDTYPAGVTPPAGMLSITPVFTPRGNTWGLTALATYSYPDSAGPYMKVDSRAVPLPLANTIILWLIVDHQFTYTIGVMMDAADASGGTAQLTLTLEGANSQTATLLLQDDPSNLNNAKDFADTFSFSKGKGTLSWKWKEGSRDGAIIGPLDFTHSTSFRMQAAFSGLSGIDKIIFYNGDGVKTELPLTNPSIEIFRYSCTCGDGVVDPTEECDGGGCCTPYCLLRTPSAVCRPSAGSCDVEEVCTGDSSDCPNDVFVLADTLCRPSVGECDLVEVCNGTAALCPDDSKSRQTCREAANTCDTPESCDGVNNMCPIDAKLPTDTKCTTSNPCIGDEKCSADSLCRGRDICTVACGSALNVGDPCPSDNKCTSNHTCDENLQCVGIDTKCVGRCGDGILASQEQCDLGNQTSPCCVNCRLASSDTVCRESTGPCDPAELCSGQWTCPSDLRQDTVRTNTGAFVSCGTVDCTKVRNCTECGAFDECGWCCETKKCMFGNSSGPSADGNGNSRCGTGFHWQFEANTCNCDQVGGCLNGGECKCGQCECSGKFGGAAGNCANVQACDGLYYALNNLSSAPKVDVCNVCAGNGTSCLGCDGVPFGNKTDICGVCGGTGTTCFELCGYTDCENCAIAENCMWFKITGRAEDAYCGDATHNPSKKYGLTDESQWRNVTGNGNCGFDFILDTTLAEKLGTGAIAGIVVAVVVAIAIFGVIGKKGYDAYTSYAHPKNTLINDNPLYIRSDRSIDNPLYVSSET